MSNVEGLLNYIHGNPMVNSPLIRPYLLGGGSFGGGTLDSHDIWISWFVLFFYLYEKQNKQPFRQ